MPLLWLWPAAACTHEDLSMCDSLQVMFCIHTSATDDGGESALVPDTLRSVCVYIVDEANEFVAAHPLDEVVVGTEYELDVDLSAGTYDFIVWTHQEAPYMVDPDKRELALDVPDTRRVSGLIPRLFYGKLEDEEVHPGSKQVVLIKLTENTNTIDVTVSGLQQHDGKDDIYELSICDNNDQYDFDNHFIVGGEAFYYVATMGYQPGETVMHTTLRTLKLAGDRNPVVSLRNITTGTTHHLSYDAAGHPVPLDLVSLIRRAYNNTVSFNERHYFRLTIEFRTDMSVTVGLDGWVQTDDGYPLS
jgi:hypothetical protein